MSSSLCEEARIRHRNLRTYDSPEREPREDSERHCVMLRPTSSRNQRAKALCVEEPSSSATAGKERDRSSIRRTTTSARWASTISEPALLSHMGQTRKSAVAIVRSGLPSKAQSSRTSRHVRSVPGAATRRPSLSLDQDAGAVPTPRSSSKPICPMDLANMHVAACGRFGAARRAISSPYRAPVASIGSDGRVFSSNRSI